MTTFFHRKAMYLFLQTFLQNEGQRSPSYVFTGNLKVVYEQRIPLSIFFILDNLEKIIDFQIPFCFIGPS